MHRPPARPGVVAPWGAVVAGGARLRRRPVNFRALRHGAISSPVPGLSRFHPADLGVARRPSGALPRSWLGWSSGARWNRSLSRRSSSAAAATSAARLSPYRSGFMGKSARRSPEPATSRFRNRSMLSNQRLDEMALSYAAPEDSPMKRAVIRAVERLTGRERAERIYREVKRGLRPESNVWAEASSRARRAGALRCGTAGRRPPRRAAGRRGQPSLRGDRRPVGCATSSRWCAAISRSWR